MVLVVKNPLVNAGRCKRCAFDPGSGRSPGGGHANPLQYSCLENSKDRGAQPATVHGVAQSQIRLKRLSSRGVTESSEYCSQGKRKGEEVFATT